MTFLKTSIEKYETQDKNLSLINAHTNMKFSPRAPVQATNSIL